MCESWLSALSCSEISDYLILLPTVEKIHSLILSESVGCKVNLLFCISSRTIGIKRLAPIEIFCLIKTEETFQFFYLKNPQMLRTIRSSMLQGTVLSIFGGIGSKVAG